MFVCAQRRQGADTPNNRLVRLQQLIPSQTRAIRLERLSQAESEALLTDLLCGARLPDRTYADILAQSEGNPYFIEEYVRMLIEQDYLQQLDGKWGINPQKTEMEIHLPASLETLIRSRVDILPDELKDIMQCMAVLGIPVETSTLEAVIEGGSVEAKLRRLESRLLVCRGAELNQWTFNHSLIESVVYQAMLKVRRRALHERVVRALESLWAGFEADHAEELAYHSVRAEDHAKALVYLMRAGERATARYANEEAIAYFEEASQLMAEQPHVLAHLRWRLAAGLGDVYRSIGRYGDSKAALQDGVAVVESGELPEEFLPALIRRLGDTAQKLGDLDAACEYYGRALTLIGTPADAATQTEVARIRTGMAWARFLQGQFETARRDCEISLAQAGRAGALNDLAAAENLLGGIYFRMTDLTSAAQHTRRAMVLREQMGYTWGVAGTLSNLGVLAIAAGDWNKGRSFFERSLALRQEVGDVEGVAIAHNNLGTLLRDQGALDQAELHFRASLDIARPFEMLFHVANSTVGLAGVLLLQGEIDAAQKAIHESLAQAEAIGAQDTRAEIYRLQAEVLMARDAWDGARRAADKAAIQAAETGNRGQESAAYRALSEIERREGRLTAAYDALNRAEQLTAEMTDELEAGRVIAQRGRLYLQEGRHGEAEADLRAAKSVFMRLGANLDLQWVEDALFARDSHNILTLHP
jgi:tetratricopeptide (TPR) repeat protein